MSHAETLRVGGSGSGDATSLDRLGVAVLGVRGRGASHLRAYLHRSDTEIVVICDPDDAIAQRRADEVAKAQRRRPMVVSHPAEAVQRNDVDIVSVATPDHWHALASIWAMQAGKDVYVEKPVSHFLTEGREIVQTSRVCQRICQAGLQSRSNPGIRAALDYLAEGELGAVTVARCIAFHRQTAEPRTANHSDQGKALVNDGRSRDIWLGPAGLERSPHPPRHYDWRWQWEFGNGALGSQAIHHIDVGRWGLQQAALSRRVFSYGGRFAGLGEGETPDTQVVHHEFADASLVAEVRSLRSPARKNIRHGVIFDCEGGHLVVTGFAKAAAFSKDGRLLRRFIGKGDHFGNFVTAVRSRRLSMLNADIEEGHLSTALVHLANISIRLGSPMSDPIAAQALFESFSSRADVAETFRYFALHLRENGVDLAAENVAPLLLGRPLHVDPESESILDDPAAQALTTPQYRRGYSLSSPTSQPPVELHGDARVDVPKTNATRL